MPLAALIIAQGSNVSAPGQALYLTAFVASPVNLSASFDATISKWTYALNDTPVGSSVPAAVLSSGPVSTSSFTPDVPGSYQIALTTQDVFGKTATDIHSFIVEDSNGIAYPSLQDTPATLNFSGNAQAGWKLLNNRNLQRIASLAAAGGGSPITFASLATTSASARKVINLDCFATVGDGGGGRFHWDPNSNATPDGGTVSYGNGNTNPAVLGRWIRDLAQPRESDISWYGASPSASAATNAAAFQAAINKVSAGGGGVVKVPTGTFSLGAFCISVPNNVSIRGQGRGPNNSVLSFMTTSDALQNIAGVVNGSSAANVSIEHLRVINTAPVRSATLMQNTPINTAGQQVVVTQSNITYLMTCRTPGTTQTSGVPTFATTVGSTTTDGSVVWVSLGVWGAAGFDQFGGTRVKVKDCLFAGFGWGVIYDQTEVASIVDNDFAINTNAHIWLVNSGDHVQLARVSNAGYQVGQFTSVVQGGKTYAFVCSVAGVTSGSAPVFNVGIGQTTTDGAATWTALGLQSPYTGYVGFFTTKIKIHGNQMQAQATPGIVDDGGIAHSIRDNYCTAGGSIASFAIASVQGLAVADNYIESAPITLSNTNYLGSGAGGSCFSGSIRDNWMQTSGPCIAFNNGSQIRIAGNSFIPGVSASACITGLVTTFAVTVTSDNVNPSSSVPMTDDYYIPFPTKMAFIPAVPLTSGAANVLLEAYYIAEIIQLSGAITGTTTVVVPGTSGFARWVFDLRQVTITGAGSLAFSNGTNTSVALTSTPTTSTLVTVITYPGGALSIGGW